MNAVFAARAAAARCVGWRERRRTCALRGFVALLAMLPAAAAAQDIPGSTLPWYAKPVLQGLVDARGADGGVELRNAAGRILDAVATTALGVAPSRLREVRLDWSIPEEKEQLRLSAQSTQPLTWLDGSGLLLGQAHLYHEGAQGSEASLGLIGRRYLEPLDGFVGANLFHDQLWPEGVGRFSAGLEVHFGEAAFSAHYFAPTSVGENGMQAASGYEAELFLPVPLLRSSWLAFEQEAWWGETASLHGVHRSAGFRVEPFTGLYFQMSYDDRLDTPASYSLLARYHLRFGAPPPAPTRSRLESEAAQMRRIRHEMEAPLQRRLRLRGLAG